MAEVVIKVGLDTADIKRGADKAAADIKTGLNGVEAAAKTTAQALQGVGTSSRNIFQLERSQLDALKGAAQERAQQYKQLQKELNVTEDELKQIIALHKEDQAAAKRAAAEQVAAARQAAAEQVKAARQAAAEQAAAFKQAAAAAKAARDQFVQGLQTIGNKLTIGLTLPLTALGAAAVKSAVDLDKSVNVLRAFTGSTAAAEARLKQLIETAARTPGLTTSLAATLDAQLRVANVTVQTIDKLLPAIGRLNAIQTIVDPQQFVRNLTQLITQNFERADLKELVGASPLAGEIIKQIFNVDSPINSEAIREAAKKLGITTADAFYDAFARAAETSDKLNGVGESLGTQLAKIKDKLEVSLRPLGQAILDDLIPVIERIIPKIVELSKAFANLSPDTQDAIVKFGLFFLALGPVLSGVSSLIGFVGSLTKLISGGGGLIGAFTGLNPVLVGIGGLLIGGAITWYEYSRAVNTASAQIDIAVRKAREATGEFINFKGESVTRTGNKFIDVRAAQSQLPTGPVSLSVDFNAIDPLTGAPRATRPQARTTPTTTPTVGGGGGADIQRQALEEAKRFKDAQLSIERERVNALNQILREEGEFRLAAYREQYDAGLITFKQFQEAKLQIQQDTLNRELELLKLEATQLEAARSTAKGVEKIQIEERLLKVYADQQIKVIELTAALTANFAEYKKALALPAFDLSKTPQEAVISTSVDPLIEQARARIAAISEAQATSDVRLLQLRQAQLLVENAIESGMIGEADGRREINALLREQRDIQIAILESRRELTDDPLELAQIGAQIESIRNMGVELTNAQRFMRGFGAAVEDVGDIFDRFGNNVARAFTSIKGLLGNLKNAVVQFFKDLLGNSLQRIVGGVLNSVFGGLFGSSSGGAGGAGRAGGGGIGSAIGAALGGGGGGLSSIGGGGGGTFGGSILNVGGLPVGPNIGVGGGLLGAFSGLLGGGPIAPTGPLTPPFNGGIFAPANQGTLGGLGTGAAGGILGNLGNLFKGIGFGLPPGAARGALAGALPLLGLSLGAGVGGQSLLGNILGGAGGALLGVGLTAAPAALAGGALGFLAPLFSNPFTAIAGAALLPVAWLLGRSKQRKADEEQSGIWLQAAVDQIMALKEPAKAGQLTKDQAKQIFESQILATFTSLIQTLKTKSVRESRLTNQVRDLRNLFETEVLALAPDKLTQRSKSGLDLIPEFATGGVVRGVDRGVDSVLAYVRPGEMVLTQAHQDAVKAVAGNDVFARVGVPNAPQSTVNGAPAFATGGVVPMRGSVSEAPIEINLAVGLNVSRAEAGRIVALGASTGDGRRVVVNQVRRANFDGV